MKQLPAGKIFTSVLDFRQVPGAVCGPTCLLPDFVYTLHGVATFSAPSGETGSVRAGSAAFVPASSVHANEGTAQRVGAGAIAVGLIVIVILLCAATWLSVPVRRVVIPALSLVLIAEGVLALSGATSNEWYLIGVRPVVQRIQPMPRPDGRVIYSSPDVDPVPTAPYIETLTTISVPTGGRLDVPSASGPQTVIVVDGAAMIKVGGETHQLGAGTATLVQAGLILAIANTGNDPVQVLDFEITPVLPGG